MKTAATNVYFPVRHFDMLETHILYNESSIVCILFQSMEIRIQVLFLLAGCHTIMAYRHMIVKQLM